MSKCEWRKLRNKYLNLQKRNMTVAKGKIRQMEAMHERNQTGANNKKSPTQGGAQEAAGDGGEGGAPAASKELEFVPGVIVRYVFTFRCGTGRREMHRKIAKLRDKECNAVNLRINRLF